MAKVLVVALAKASDYDLRFLSIRLNFNNHFCEFFSLEERVKVSCLPFFFVSAGGNKGGDDDATSNAGSTSRHH